MEASFSIPRPKRAAVAAARDFVRDVLSEWECSSVSYEAELIVSELATNAVIHARSPVTVTLRFADSALRIEVSDLDRNEPVMTAALLDGKLSGRGLSIVAATARSWGFESRADGKVVWAELDPTVRAEPLGVEDLVEVETLADALDQLPPGSGSSSSPEGSTQPQQ